MNTMTMVFLALLRFSTVCSGLFIHRLLKAVVVVQVSLIRLVRSVLASSLYASVIPAHLIFTFLSMGALSGMQIMAYFIGCILIKR